MPKAISKGEAKASPVPEFTRYKRVDTIIECYPITRDTEKELLKLMPNAYEGELPGEDDWPEPDAPRDRPYMLANIWAKLSPEAKADIGKAVSRHEWEEDDA